MDLNHPLLQSVAIPLAMALLGAGLLRAVLGATQGPRWALAAVGVAVVFASVWLLGWRLPPGGAPEKLAWIFVGAWLLASVLNAVQAGPRGVWGVAVAAWLIVLWWLGADGVRGVAAGGVGALVLAALVRGVSQPAGTAAMLVVASLGLAAQTLASGSLLLFQVGLLLAAAMGGGALWLWPKARVAFGAAWAAGMGLCWLALAQAVALLTSATPLALLLLALIFGAGLLVDRLLARRAGPVTLPLWVAAAAAVLVAAALGAGALLPGTAPGVAPGGADDPYYQPKW
jgi:hypothetical protein